MKLDSPLFDRIRIKTEPDPPRPEAEALKKPGMCEHPGCLEPGDFRAPKGRGREGQYWRFCVAHVREYNASYNYFAGLPDDAVASFQKSAMVGHRPTWKMGNAGRTSPNPQGTNAWSEAEPVRPGVADPLGLYRGREGLVEPDAAQPRRPTVTGPDRRAFESLGLEPGSTPEEIKIRFKALVKRFHPDANGGDRSMEERFREIVQAHARLKAAGFCT
jgi:hypothetical protein